LGYPDFLRHIVNPKLSRYMRENSELRNHVDEIRRMIFDAENKYRFSVFNGNPEKLADYLASDDFILLIRLFKTVKAVDVLKEILEETRNKYSTLPRVVEEIEKILSKIEEIAREEQKE
jgi:hypothetical protein